MLSLDVCDRVGNALRGLVSLHHVVEYNALQDCLKTNIYKKRGPDMMRLIALCLISLIAFGCDGAEVFGDGVEARATESAIFLTNKTGETVYYFVVGRNTSHLIDWVPIVSDENAILKNQTIEIDRNDIDRDRVETEALVYWWFAVIVDNVARPGAVQNFVLPLRNDPF